MKRYPSAAGVRWPLAIDEPYHSSQRTVSHGIGGCVVDSGIGGVVGARAFGRAGLRDCFLWARSDPGWHDCCVVGLPRAAPRRDTGAGEGVHRGQWPVHRILYAGVQRWLHSIGPKYLLLDFGAVSSGIGALLRAVDGP